MRLQEQSELLSSIHTQCHKQEHQLQLNNQRSTLALQLSEASTQHNSPTTKSELMNMPSSLNVDMLSYHFHFHFNRGMSLIFTFLLKQITDCLVLLESINTPLFCVQ